REEGMAGRADFEVQLVLRRFGRERVAARAPDFDFLIRGMNSFLHGCAPWRRLTAVRRPCRGRSEDRLVPILPGRHERLSAGGRKHRSYHSGGERSESAREGTASKSRIALPAGIRSCSL